jgi:hypothetical protein
VQILLTIQDILGYVLLAAGYLMIMLLGFLAYAMAMERQWGKFAWNVLWAAFAIAMVAKPSIALAHQLGF